MILFFSALFFLLGAVIASFVGVLAGRLNTGTPIVNGRSKCDACGKFLGAFDLVPILPYLVRGGRARCCSARVSPFSTLAELLLGSLYVCAYIKLGLSIDLFLLIVALAALLALVLYDLAHSILPPSFLIVFVLAALSFAYVQASDLTVFGLSLLVSAACGLFLAAIHFFSRGRAMGLADAPLAFGLSLIAGADALSGFVFSFWIGALIGITILVRTPKGARMGIEVPFAPFLAAGFLLAYFTEWNPFTFISNLLARLMGV